MKTNNIMPMTITIRVFFLIGLTVFAMPALAQTCKPDYEMIVEMKEPEFGADNLWDTVYGDEENIEEFDTVLALESGNIIVAGIKDYEHAQMVGPTLPGKRLVVAEIDARGRVVWSRETLISDLMQVQKILPAEKGYIALISTKAADGNVLARLLFLDVAGNIVRERNIGEKGKDLLPRDMAMGWDNKSYVMVASVSRSGESSHVQFYHIDKVGGILTQRSYQIGVNTILLGITRSDKNFYVATGQTGEAQNKQNAWVVKLNGDGEIIWQRQYKRGRGARLISAADFGDAGVIVTGQALSATDESSAGWVMMLDHDDGNTIWQRYYRGKNHNTTIGVVTDAGRSISVLINSKNPGNENGVSMEDEFVRLLTLNSRGIAVYQDNFYNGHGVIAAQMVADPTNSMRFIVGKTQVLYRGAAEPDSKEPPKAHASLEAWALAAQKKEITDDICATQPAPAETKTKTPAPDKAVLDAETIFQ